MKQNKLAIGIIILAVIAIAWAGYLRLRGGEQPTENENEIVINEPVVPITSPTIPPSTTNTNSPSEPENNNEEDPPAETEPVTFKDASVPFTAQAPTGDWEDQRQQDGCEEASALMAVYWAQGKSLNSSIALREILAISDFEQEKYGEYRDVSVEDVVDWIFKDYFNYDKAAVKRDVTINDMIAELQKGNIIIVPADGQRLGNPYFSPPGPERHMLVVRGYDPAKKQFITNDPGTRRGQAYRYNENTLYNAIMAYETGYHVPVSGMPKHIIVVSK